MRNAAAGLALALIAALCVPVFIANMPGAEQAVDLAISDKAAPIMDVMMEVVPEPEPEPEVYYEPTYTYSDSYWYESDDAEAEAAAKEWIADRESGGDYNATNGQYIGRYQLSADKLDGDHSPEHQEEVAEAYVAERYGSWSAAKEHWQRNGWY